MTQLQIKEASAHPAWQTYVQGCIKKGETHLNQERWLAFVQGWEAHAVQAHRQQPALVTNPDNRGIGFGN